MNRDIDVNDIKEAIFDKKHRFLCDTRYCGLCDGYCPTYECGMLDKLKRYTDKQWQNSFNKVCKNGTIDMYIDDFAEELLEDLLHKRPLRKGDRN